MMTKEESTKIVTFMSPRAGVLMMLGRDQISHYSEYVLFSFLSIYSIDCLCVYFMMWLLIYKYEPF